jgi:N-acetylneuraminic acid mutarotase
MYRYDPSKNEWRKFSSPTQPGPRAAHQMVGTVAGGGRLWVHGGEYCEWEARASVLAHRPSPLT